VNATAGVKQLQFFAYLVINSLLNSLGRIYLIDKEAPMHHSTADCL